MATPTDAQMRVQLGEVYKHSEFWPGRVKTMSAAQVLAIYLKFKSEGKIK